MRKKSSLIFLTFLAINSICAQFDKTENVSKDLFVWLKNGNQATLELANSILETNFPKEVYLLKKSFVSNDTPFNRIFEIKNIRSIHLDSLIILLQQAELLTFVEEIPEYFFDYTPNDLHSNQYNLKKINAEGAWNLSKGGKSILVALVDDGLDTLHPDLQPALWHNVNEIPNNSLDDDGNGYVDDYFGWDMADGDNNPCVVPSDQLNHGTHCAGIIGAATDNSKGIASIGFNLKIMALKCGKNGQPYIYNPYQAVEYAIDNGAKVISMSWGGGSYSTTYQAIFNKAYKNNVVCVAASGNSSTNTIHYPAGYSYVISVGSTDINDVKSGFSNYGNWIDVMAPGSAIYSTFPGNSYGNMSGTSMACPLVSGLCGLMLSKNSLATNVQIENCLKSGCENINALNGSFIGQMGAGRINAYNSLLCLKSVVSNFNASKNTLCNNDTVQFYNLSAGVNLTYSWKFLGGTPSTSTLKNPIIKYNSTGKYKVELIADDGTTRDTLSIDNYIKVEVPTVKFVGNQTIVKGDYGTIRAEFSGAGPWDLEYTDGVTSYFEKGILQSPHFILVQLNKTKIFKPLNVQRNGCIGSVYDSSKITVLESNSDCDSTSRFIHRLGGTGTDIARGMISLNDSSLIVVGETNSYGSGAGDGLIYCISKTGNLLWSNTFGGNELDGFWSVCKDAKENSYVCGYSYSGVSGRAALVVKYNRKGKLMWQKYFGGTSTDYTYSVKLARDGKSILLAGLAISTTHGSEDYLWSRIDTTGNVLWCKAIGNAELNRLLSAVEDKNGNFVLVGFTANPFPYHYTGLIKLDKNLNIKWQKEIKNSSSNSQIISGHSINNWKDRAYIITGFTGFYNGSGYNSKEFFIMKLDTNGNTLFAKRFNYSFYNVWETKILGDYIYMVGSNGGLEAFVLKLDSNANILKAKTFTGFVSSDLISLVIESDESIFLAGNVNISGNIDALLIKTNCSLDAFCNSKSISPQLLTFNTNSVDPGFTVLNYSVFPSISNNSAIVNPAKSFVCKSDAKQIIKPTCKLKASFVFSENCTGDSVYFESKSKDSLYSISNWIWDFGDGTKLSGKGAVKHAYKNSGKYAVKLKVTSVLNQFTCTDSIINTYNSSDSFKTLRRLKDTIICFNDSIQRTFAPMRCGTEPYIYSWTPNKNISSSTIANPYFSPKKSGKYFVKVIDKNNLIYLDSFSIKVDSSCCKSKARLNIERQEFCVFDSIKVKNTSTYGKNVKFTWKITGIVNANYTSNVLPIIVPKISGIIKIKLVLKDKCTNGDSTELLINVNLQKKANAGADTFVCFPDTLLLGLEPVGRSIYKWFPTLGLNNPYLANPQANITKPITYQLKMIDENGCISYDSVQIKSAKNIVDLGNDTVLCEGVSLKLKNKLPASNYLWNTGSTASEILVNKSGNYWLEIKRNNCISRDTINVLFDSMPSFTLGPDVQLCSGQFPYQIIPKNLRIKPKMFNWENGSTQLMRTVIQKGGYVLEMKNNTCAFKDSIYVDSLSFPKLHYTGDTTICIGDTVIFTVPIVTGLELYHNGMLISNSIYLTNTSTNIFKIKNKCEEYTDTFNIKAQDCSCKLFVPNAFTPSHSIGLNDVFKVESACKFDFFAVDIYNKWGGKVFHSNAQDFKWDGMYLNKRIISGNYAVVITLKHKYTYGGKEFKRVGYLYVEE